MPQSITLSLADGRHIQADFQYNTISFQSFDPAGNPIGASHTVHEGRGSTTIGQPLTEIENIAAVPLSDGRFAIAWDEHFEPWNGDPDWRVFNVYISDGTYGRYYETTTDVGIARTGPAAAAPQLYDLSLGRVAAVNSVLHPDGSTTAQLSVVSFEHGSATLSLPSTPDSITPSGGDLVLGWRDGEQVSAGGLAVDGAMTGGSGADTPLRVLGTGRVDGRRR